MASLLDDIDIATLVDPSIVDQLNQQLMECLEATFIESSTPNTQTIEGIAKL